MKTTFRILSACLILTLASCSRSNDDVESSTPTTPQAQSTTVSSGTWRVTLFTDSGNDETSDFSGFSFQFASNGTVTATRNGVAKNGTWNISSRSNGSNKFNLNLGAKTDDNKPLGELTDDWKIISVTTNEIKLTDDNPASNEFLTFVKNP